MFFLTKRYTTCVNNRYTAPIRLLLLLKGLSLTPSRLAKMLLPNARVPTVKSYIRSWGPSPGSREPELMSIIPVHDSEKFTATSCCKDVYLDMTRFA